LAYANEEASMTEPRVVSLFRNGRNQAIRIPVEFEMPGTEVLVSKEGDRLIVEPKPKKTLAEVLDEMEPLSRDEWPDIDDSDLLPLEDVEL
jgi:antitoxin VapB